jgi:hypothetical protein
MDGLEDDKAKVVAQGDFPLGRKQDDKIFIQRSAKYKYRAQHP